MTTPKDKSQEGPYRAAWENGYCVVRDANAPEGNRIMMMVPDDMHWLACRLNAAYAAGQAAQREPVAMIYNDYDASLSCSNCGTDGGFSMYDDLDWAKCCPGCGRPISEQVSAKGVRTPHPLYRPPTNP